MLWWMIGLPLCAGVIVPTKYGDVEGDTITLQDDWHAGIQIDTYLSIPFARPPVGPDRFMNPSEPDPWEGVLPVLETGNSCLTTGEDDSEHWKDEDCLHLHIFTPSGYSGDPLPVLVFIHGGGFTGGSNLWDVGHFLAAQDVVVVMPNYRVGIFGFAYTEDDASPGNMGLRDITLALQFVQENIANFNGDPGKVTVMGQSAGGCAAGDMVISPESEGLIHQAALISGNEYAVWCYFGQGHNNLGHLQQVASRFDCPLGDTQEMVDCLRDVPAGDLSQRSSFNCSVYDRLCGSWRPVVDGAGGFIPESPWVLREKGLFHEVPMFIGYTEHDAFITRSMTREDFVDRIEFVADTYSSLYYYEDQKQDVAAGMNYFYSPWPHIHDLDKNGENFNYLITDGWYGSPADMEAKIHSKVAAVYYYVFNYVSDQRIFHPDHIGATHSMDLPYVFGEPFRADNPDINDQFWWDGSNYNDDDRDFSYFVMQLYTNFAKYGDPTPTALQSPDFMGSDEIMWDEYTSDNYTYIYLGQEAVEVLQDYRQKEYSFWQNYLYWLYFRYEGRSEDF